MISSEKYYIEVHLECVLESDMDNKVDLIKKINSTIQKLIKDQKVVHYSSNVNSVSEDDIIREYMAPGMYGDN